MEIKLNFLLYCADSLPRRQSVGRRRTSATMVGTVRGLRASPFAGAEALKGGLVPAQGARARQARGPRPVATGDWPVNGSLRGRENNSIRHKHLHAQPLKTHESSV